MNSGLSFDLVVATIGRAAELRRFLESVVMQSHTGVRVIIVDQSPDERVARVGAEFDGRLSVLHLKSQPGLSRARNIGLAHVSADVVAFPDDDCWYPANVLRDVAAALDGHPDWDGVSVMVRDSHGRPSSMRWDSESGGIDRFNVWRRAISISFFLRSHVTSSVGEFDAHLGAGADTRWGSGEESDYLLRALSAGFHIFFEPSRYVGHESPTPAPSRRDARDAHLRGLGHGHVLRRHQYPLWFVGWRVAQLAAGSVWFLISGRFGEARYYFAMARGRVRGWLARD